MDTSQSFQDRISGVVSKTVDLWENSITSMIHYAQVAVTTFTRWRGDVIHEASTPYQSLHVVDRENIRWLLLDGDAHSVMDMDEPYRDVFEYTRYFHLGFLFNEDIENVLFIGGGGFTGPKRFIRDYDLKVDVIEKDPEVVSVAQKFFNADVSGDLNAYTGDGREFLEEADKNYDLIVLDAFKLGRAPSELTTVEFMQLIRENLSEDGVLVANLLSTPRGPLSRFYHQECETMARVFPRVYSFRTLEGFFPQSFFPQNIEVVATMDDELATLEDIRQRNEKGWAEIDLSEEIETYNHFSPSEDGKVRWDNEI